MPALPKIKKTPLPQGNLANSHTKLCQAAVPLGLYEAAKAEWQARGLTTRQVVIWALKEYLAATNPRQAAKLRRAGYGD